MNELKINELKMLIGKSVGEAKLLVGHKFYIRDMTGVSACAADCVLERIDIKTDKEGKITSYSVG